MLRSTRLHGTYAAEDCVASNTSSPTLSSRDRGCNADQADEGRRGRSGGRRKAARHTDRQAASKSQRKRPHSRGRRPGSPGPRRRRQVTVEPVTPRGRPSRWPPPRRAVGQHRRRAVLHRRFPSCRPAPRPTPTVRLPGSVKTPGRGGSPPFQVGRRDQATPWRWPVAVPSISPAKRAAATLSSKPNPTGSGSIASRARASCIQRRSRAMVRPPAIGTQRIEPALGARLETLPHQRGDRGRPPRSCSPPPNNSQRPQQRDGRARPGAQRPFQGRQQISRLRADLAHRRLGEHLAVDSPAFGTAGEPLKVRIAQLTQLAMHEARSRANCRIVSSSRYRSPAGCTRLLSTSRERRSNTREPVAADRPCHGLGGLDD